jgi:kynurenine formamidase
MKTRTFRHLGCVLLVVAVATLGAVAGEQRIIDLTYPFSADSVYWPTAEGFVLTVESAARTEKGYYYAANSFCAAEHGGTHVDAPIHFSEGQATVDEIPLDRLMAPGILVDVAAKAAKDPDYLVSVDDLKAWEKAHGPIADGIIVLLRTGWGRFYPDREKYLGTARRGPEAVPLLHFPGLDPAAARWLVEERKIAAIGLDTASIDHGPSETFLSHQILFEAGIPAFENVAHLDRLPPTGFEIIALPMKIQGGSGGPLRIIATLAE